MFHQGGARNYDGDDFDDDVAFQIALMESQETARQEEENRQKNMAEGAAPTGTAAGVDGESGNGGGIGERIRSFVSAILPSNLGKIITSIFILNFV